MDLTALVAGAEEAAKRQTTPHWWLLNTASRSNESCLGGKQDKRSRKSVFLLGETAVVSLVSTPPSTDTRDIGPGSPSTPLSAHCHHVKLGSCNTRGKLCLRIVIGKYFNCVLSLLIHFIVSNASLYDD